MRNMKRVKVKRHPLIFRILHWLLFLETLLLLITGFSLSQGLNFEIFPRYLARNLHIVIGSLWLMTVVFFFYYFFTSEEYKWVGLSRLGYAFDYFMAEVRHFLDGKRVPEPIRYDPVKKKYIEKVVPSEVLSFWGWFSLLTLMGITGIALIFPDHFRWLANIAHSIIPDFGRAFASLRALHFIIACFVMIFILFHAYAVFVFGLFKSMITGYREEPIVDEE